jgi:ABC-type transport system involved in cytochrome c biogenesis permease subunit
MIWDRWLSDSRLRDDRRYKGTPVQQYPEKEVRRVYDAYVATQEAYRSGDGDKFAATATRLTGVLADVSNEMIDYPGTDTISLELTFNKINPFQKAWIFGLMASVLLALGVGTLSRSPRVGAVFYYAGLAGYLAALGWAIYGFYCRVSISGRPPVSDMYESIIWVSFMTAVFGFIFEMIYRRGYIALAGGLVSTLGFLLADQLPLTFSPSIKPISAVLRSQYWLIIHVLTIVSSYAALALAWGLGNINIGLIMFAPHRKDQIKTLSHYSYKAIQVGVILLFLGTMLGGFWAAESWGRFWGWDPKEVWALIAFIVYIIPLHARYVGWVKDFGLAACSVVCFSAVVMAWYGVNFILGAGLHSYGFGSGNNAWLYMAGMANISLVVHAALRYTSTGRHLVAE